MRARTAFLPRYLVTPCRRARTRLQLLARSEVGYGVRAAMTTLALAAAAGGLGYLVDELRLTWNRLQRPARDEAGYATKTVIIAGVVVVITVAAGAILYMQVISKAIHTRRSCYIGRPCG